MSDRQDKELRLETPAGYELGVTSFIPNDPSGDCIVISSATGVLQRYYASFAHFLASKGYHVYTFDYAGIGASGSKIPELQKCKADLHLWGSNDQATVVAYARERHPSGKLHLITHSIGGQLLPFNANYHLIDQVLMVASQSGYWKHYPSLQYPKMWLFWHGIIPILTKNYGYFPAKKLGLFENLPAPMAYQWMRWGKHPDYMLGEFSKEKTYFSAIRVPMLMLSFPKDSFAPLSAVEWLASQFDQADLTHLHLQPQEYGINEVGHFGFFKKSFSDPLWSMTFDWLQTGNFTKSLNP